MEFCSFFLTAEVWWDIPVTQLGPQINHLYHQYLSATKFVFTNKISHFRQQWFYLCLLISSMIKGPQYQWEPVSNSLRFSVIQDSGEDVYFGDSRNLKGDKPKNVEVGYKKSARGYLLNNLRSKSNFILRFNNLWILPVVETAPYIDNYLKKHILHCIR